MLSVAEYLDLVLASVNELPPMELPISEVNGCVPVFAPDHDGVTNFVSVSGLNQATVVPDKFNERFGT